MIIPMNDVLNIVYMSTITNIPTAWNFEVISDKFNLNKVCTYIGLISYFQQENNTNTNNDDGDDNDDGDNNNNNVTYSCEH
jgi:hypothetical protein